MLWITRSHIHVDRVACPWLITRFIDNQAEFLFVPKSQIEPMAQETGAIPFDVPGVELGHHEGRCSFESFLLKYGLTDLALQHKMAYQFRVLGITLPPELKAADQTWYGTRNIQAPATPTTNANNGEGATSPLRHLAFQISAPSAGL